MDIKSHSNPLLLPFDTPFGTPPFSQIRLHHFEPAFEVAFAEQLAKIDDIVKCEEEPTFENVIERYESSGDLLDKVGGVFYNLTYADTTDELDAIDTKLASISARHSNEIKSNDVLFKKIDAVYQKEKRLREDNQINSALTTEQWRLLESTHRSFMRFGAALTPVEKERLKAINIEISELKVTFSQHLMAAINAFNYIVEVKDGEHSDELEGLNDDILAAAEQEAERVSSTPGVEGVKRYAFTLKDVSRLPLLTNAKNRNIRKIIYEGYTTKCDCNDANDNTETLTRILKLRLEKAKLMGFECYGDYALDVKMAKNASNGLDFLEKLSLKAFEMAEKEALKLTSLLREDLKNETATLEPYDWWYYTEKVAQSDYGFDENSLKPYFPLNSVREGVFEVTRRLYGIDFKPLNDTVDYYTTECDAFEVIDADQSHIGVIYFDYHPRPGKRGGAWMSAFREQKQGVRPVVINVCNFPRINADSPGLLSLDEVVTLFHEFGHGLHGLLSNCQYQSMGGTNVVHDFLELPSQILEHWATHPEVLPIYAKHWQTGETIPAELVQKIKATKDFNEGFHKTEVVAAAILDMKLHMIKDPKEFDVNTLRELEDKIVSEMGLIHAIRPRYRPTYFSHITGGYEAGYYSYLWARELDTYGFEYFEENGVFNREAGMLFRKSVLEKGDSEEAMALYRRFRGSEPPTLSAQK